MPPELDERAAPAYVGAVLLDGVEVDLDRVLASVTIRNARDEATGPIQASTATLGLRRLSHAELRGFEVGVSLEVDDVDGDSVFQGTLTDATLTNDDPRVDAVLSVIGTGPLATLGYREVGGHSWPAETWASRMGRILREAGSDIKGHVIPGATDVPMAATVPDPDSGVYQSMSALDALEADRDAVGATAYDEGNGWIAVQAYEGRIGMIAPLELDPELVLYAPEWTQTLDVVNRIVLGYGYGAGTVTVDDPDSQARYGVRWSGLFDSGLRDAATAQTRAQVWLDRLAVPVWTLPGLTLLERHPLTVGRVLELTELPASAPLTAWTPIVEGWTDTIEGPSWTQDVVLSDPSLSGLGFPWRDVPIEVLWSTVDPSCRWADAHSLDNLIGGARHA